MRDEIIKNEEKNRRKEGGVDEEMYFIAPLITSIKKIIQKGEE